MRNFKLKQDGLHVLIISGPTASGKSQLSLNLADRINGEIINGDVGQFYSSFSVGTVKPFWQNEQIQHHLFDIIDSPRDLNVCEYRKLVLEKVNEIWSRKKVPIIVGGSSFYLKSLFFPPANLNHDLNKFKINFGKENLWEKLNKVDPERAKDLHQNDLYRIERALRILLASGAKPSSCKPKFSPSFNFSFLFLNADKDLLKESINKRTEMMFGSSKLSNWIEEVESIMGTEWEEFLCKKKLIGYVDIINWIKEGKKEKTKPALIEAIQTKTWQYARKQLIFWRKLKKDLENYKFDSSFQCKYIELKDHGNNIDVISLIDTLRLIDDQQDF